jgi:hypothetical protein
MPLTPDKIITYPEQFPPGTRVLIKASPYEGTDRFFNNRTGTVKRWAGYTSAEIEFDKPVKDLPNPYLIVCHNLRHLPSALPSHEGER